MTVRRRLLPLALLALGACATTSGRAPAAEVSPALAQPATTAALDAVDEARPLRVMNYNIKYGTFGLERIAEVIRKGDADVVALEEVDRLTIRSGRRDYTAELARLAGYPYHVFFRATAMNGGEYGVALLSRFPLVDTENRALPSGNLEPRTVGRATVQLPGGRAVSVYVTHLTHLFLYSRVRQQQARAILHWMRQDPQPKLLLGDMNDGDDSPTLALFHERLNDVWDKHGKGPETTFPMPLFLPNQRLDYALACDNWTGVSARVLREKASDHYPLMVEVALKPLPASAPVAAGQR